MEERLNEHILTKEYVLNCIAKNEKKISELAYKTKQYAKKEDEIKFKELVAYRKPFIDFLMRDCNMSLEDIKTDLKEVKPKNIPTKKVCDQIREIIKCTVYWIE